MTAADRAFAAEMVAAGYLLTGGDFLTGPAELLWHRGRPVSSRTCYEFTGDRWEGFATFDRLDDAPKEISPDPLRN